MERESDRLNPHHANHSYEVVPAHHVSTDPNMPNAAPAAISAKSSCTASEAVT